MMRNAQRRSDAMHLRFAVAGHDLDGETFLKGFSLADRDRPRVGTPGVIVRDDFVFQAGQPEEIRAAYRKAMGLPDAEGPPVDRPLN